MLRINFGMRIAAIDSKGYLYERMSISTKRWLTDLSLWFMLVIDFDFVLQQLIVRTTNEMISEWPFLRKGDLQLSLCGLC